MKMKKLMSLLLVGAMSASVLAGCGGGSAAPAAPAAPAGDAKEEAAAGEEAAEEAPAGEAGGTWFLGGIGPVTGGAAIYGTNVKNAIQIAVDEVNAAGGIGGYQIAYSFQDDEHDAEKAVNAYNTLKDWGMQILLGTVTSTPCIAVADYSYEDNIFQLTPSGTAVDCVKNDNAFRVCFSDPNQGLASAQYIGRNGLGQKVAVIYNSSDVYSSGIYETFMGESANQPFEVVSQEAFTEDSKTDFSVQLQKAQDAGADLLFLPIYYDAASVILKQADAMGFKPVIFGVDGMDGILTVEDFDTTLAEDVMLLTPFVATAEDDLTKNFVAEYNSRFGETPNQFAADAYDGVYAIKAAIEEAGLTPDMSNEELCAGLKDAFTKITVKGLTDEGITWDASGEPNKTPKAMVIKDGIYVPAK